MVQVIFGLLLGLILSFCAGYLTMRVFWPPKLADGMTLFLTCAATGLGFGIVSIVYFAWLIAGHNPREYTVMPEAVLITVLLCCVAYVQFLQPKKKTPPVGITSRRAEISTLPLYVIFSFPTLLAIAGARFILLVRETPYGEWDAISIWNMRARFIFRSGEAWRNSFSEAMSWSHPDYPLLLPLNTVRFWNFTGGDSRLVPEMIAMIFTFMTVALLYATLVRMRSRYHAIMACSFLLGISFFIKHGSSQYADVPIGFYYLLTIALYSLHDTDERIQAPKLLVLAALGMGFAAWTKNEGLLFVAAIPIARFTILAIQKRLADYRREMALILPGLVPIMSILLYMKIWLAPPNDIVRTDLSSSDLMKLTDASRYSQLIVSCTQEIIRSGWIYPFAFLFLYLVYRKASIPKHEKSLILFIILLLFIMVIGVIPIYVLTNWDMAVHIGNSLPRVILQLWPSIVYLCFLMIPDGTNEGTQSQRPCEA